VLAAVREQAIKHYATPQFMGAMVNRVRQIPLMFMLVPGVLLLLAILLRHPIENMIGLGGGPHDEAFYASFFPHWLLIAFYTTLTLLVFVGLIGGLFKFWKAMKLADEKAGRAVGEKGIIASFIATVMAILTHRQFGKCTRRKNRRSTHLYAFYGFIALFVVTIYAVLDIYIFPMLGLDTAYPFNLIHPMKILANIGGIVLVVGSLKAILDRRKDTGDTAGSTSFDQIFIWLLLLVGVTGFITEIFRFTVGAGSASGAMQYTAYAIYFVHLMCVFGLLVYLPYSKFAHIWYRTLAMVYAEYSGRTKEYSQLEPAAAVATEAAAAGEGSAEVTGEGSEEEPEKESEEETESAEESASTQ
jgi:quinone-modifying oxidoreductase subunit QmoC